MALTPGTRLGTYEVLGPLGAGGMGEVYRARDTRLGREVAIKVLPEGFSADPDRLLRFEREARVLATLSHPNLAGIFGVAETDGRRYLALEYVKGETLAARLSRGPLPIEEAVEICHQIASGMEAAHEAGVVHRDLKPANVMVTPENQVKILDFGLAKGPVTQSEVSATDSPTLTESPALQHSPTIGTPATLPGVILGTAAYLSPEQARGKALDRRTDIWSFGCVLYECLTGRRAFEGETITDLVATILKGEVEWSRLPEGTPAGLRELVQHCLEKDARKRLRDMGDARLALEAIREGRGDVAPVVHVSRPLSVRSVARAAPVGLVGALVGIAIWSLLGPGRQTASPSRPVVRSAIDIPLEVFRMVPFGEGFQAFEGGISPDGRYIVLPGRPPRSEREQASASRLYRRRLDSYRFEEVEGSEGFRSFKFAPDGQWLYFTAPVLLRSTDLRLMKAPLDGSGATVSVAPWDPSWDPELWMPLLNGDLLVSTQKASAYVRVRASGAPPEAPVKLDVPGTTMDGACYPWAALPGDRGALLVFSHLEQGRAQQGIACLDLKRGTIKLLLREGTSPAYSSSGHLVFLRQSTLFAVPFDLGSLETRGEPVAVGEGVLERSRLCLSREGTLTYRYGTEVLPPRRLAVADRRGRVSDWTRDPLVLDGPPAVSPDGRQAAFPLVNSKHNDEIWISERGSASRRRIGMDGASYNWPVWSPDGRQIAFYGGADDENVGIYVQGVDERAPRMLCRSTDAVLVPNCWSPDGKYLLATVIGGDRGVANVVRVVTDPGSDSAISPTPLFSGPAKYGYAYFSPDGRWVAYHSNETGEYEVYAARFLPDGSVGTPLALGRGVYAAWSRSGREVLFMQDKDVAPRSRIVSVSLKLTTPPSVSTPTPRWDLDSLRCFVGWRYWDILPGDQFLFVQKGEDESVTDRIACVTNFFEELRSKVGEARNR